MALLSSKISFRIHTLMLKKLLHLGRSLTTKWRRWTWPPTNGFRSSLWRGSPFKWATWWRASSTSFWWELATMRATPRIWKRKKSSQQKIPSTLQVRIFTNLNHYRISMNLFTEIDEIYLRVNLLIAHKYLYSFGIEYHFLIKWCTYFYISDPGISSHLVMQIIYLETSCTQH